MAEARLNRLRCRRCFLVRPESVPQPSLESRTAHGPRLTVSTDTDVRPHPAVGGAELVGSGRQIDQDVGLLAAAFQQLLKKPRGVVFFAAADADELEHVVPGQFVLGGNLINLPPRDVSLMLIWRAEHGEQLAQHLAQFVQILFFHCLNPLFMVRLPSASGSPARLAASSSMSCAKSEPPSSRARHAAQNRMLLRSPSRALSTRTHSARSPPLPPLQDSGLLFVCCGGRTTRSSQSGSGGIWGYTSISRGHLGRVRPR